MEFVALSDSVLTYLAKEDRELRPYFRGVFAADQLPKVLNIPLMPTLSTLTLQVSLVSIG